jgi:MFS family permease
MLVYTLNQLDRQILTILLEPIKRDLDISDTPLGLLSGLAFALLYTLLGLPIARIVDRGFNRVRIVSISIFVWSLMTVCCGLASRFLRLRLARVGVGIGEAGATPASHSLLADYFDEHERSGGMSLYSLGMPVGGFLGLLLGGILNQWYGWKIAFMAVGIPGLLIALILPFLVSEPRVQRVEPAPQDSLDFLPAIKALFATKTFVHACLATSLFTFSGYAFATWGPSYPIRTFGVETGILGITLAFSSLIAGGGVLLCGWLSDKLVPRD